MASQTNYRSSENDSEQPGLSWNDAVMRPTSSSSVMTSEPDAFNEAQTTSPSISLPSAPTSAFKMNSPHYQVECEARGGLELHTGLSTEIGQMYVTPEATQRMIPQAISPSSRLPNDDSITSEFSESQPGNAMPAGKCTTSRKNSSAIDRRHSTDGSAQASTAAPDVLPSPSSKEEKRCRNCDATRTPMWRNDSEGNKTLCNACGVRLQRQMNKAKQIAQTNNEPPTSLLSGKMPRSRTSPAKLSKEEKLEAGRNGEGNSHSRRPSTAPASEERSSRAESLNKRKSLEIQSQSRHLGSLSRKRSCNDLTLGAPSLSPTAVSTTKLGPIDCDLVIVGASNGMPSATRIVQQCVVFVDPSQPGPPGLPPGRLRVDMKTGRPAASCAFPKIDCGMTFDSQNCVWRWDGTAQWGLMFRTVEDARAFEALMANWANSGQHWAMPVSPTSPVVSFNSRRTASFSNLGSASGYKINGSDSKFLAHINMKIKQETNNTPAGSPGADPKDLSTPVSNVVFERLCSMFELLREKMLGSPQGLSEPAAAAVCDKCPWAPNKAVGVAIFRYWLKKTSSQAYRASQAAPAGNFPVQASSPARLDTSNSFAGMGLASAPMLTPGNGGMSDISALTFQDMPPHAQAGTSEESSAASYAYGNGFAPGAMQERLAFSAQPTFPPPEGPNGARMLAGDPFMRPAWDPSFVMPMSGFEQYAHGSFDSGQGQDWDPLDPENLAKIADPNLEPKRSSNLGGLQGQMTNSAGGSNRETSGFSSGGNTLQGGMRPPPVCPSPRARTDLGPSPLQDLSSGLMTSNMDLGLADFRRDVFGLHGGNLTCDQDLVPEELR